MPRTIEDQFNKILEECKNDGDGIKTVSLLVGVSRDALKTDPESLNRILDRWLDTIDFDNGPAYSEFVYALEIIETLGIRRLDSKLRNMLERLTITGVAETDQRKMRRISIIPFVKRILASTQ